MIYTKLLGKYMHCVPQKCLKGPCHCHAGGGGHGLDEYLTHVSFPGVLELGRFRSSLAQYIFTGSQRLYRIVTRACFCLSPPMLLLV